MGSSLLIMLVGMLVPVLAAAPFYIQDRRVEQRAAEELRRAENGDAAGDAEASSAVPVETPRSR